MKQNPKAEKKPNSLNSKAQDQNREVLENWLQLAQLRAEKCELQEAETAYGMALQHAKNMGDLRGQMEALAGLLRLAGHAVDEAAISRLDAELDSMIAAYPDEVPPLVWHCKGTVAWFKQDVKVAQRCWHRYLRALRADTKLSSKEELLAKAYASLALFWRETKPKRARQLSMAVLNRESSKDLKGTVGILYLVLGHIAEQELDTETALEWYKKAHARFLAEHNWYYHLYVLYGYARIARRQQNYAQAYWYLDMLEKAAWGQHFNQFRREIAIERSRLEQDAVDLLIDSRKGVVKIRDSGTVSLRKQYILLHILEALSNAHSRPGDDMERGLSKAEIIECVWNESYRPEAHDNKLYYNINRLRKLIEPDVKKPQYLLNWKEGYRLAPGLRVQFLGGRSSLAAVNQGNQRGESE
ncbi:MAG TPA: helix-turn-helix domain-containing protein [Bdellovibrionota bacterium]|nr:helix-turn-helix domain-containing protein [Bdellovibrionota bacterium]